MNKIANLLSKKTIDYCRNELVILRYWDKSTNFGDALNPYLFEQILKKKTISSYQFYNFRKKPELLGIGSILSGDLSKCVVFGSGIIKEDVTIRNAPKEVLQVRGKLTQKKLKESNIIIPDYFGDPALMLPLIYKPNISKKFKLGFVIHYNDSDANNYKELCIKNPDFLFINPLEHYLSVINQILSCEYIASSSLHGLIIADAYQIPNVRLQCNDLTGGNFKFNDYYSSINVYNHNIIDFNHVYRNSSNFMFSKFYANEINLDLVKMKNRLVDFVNQNY